MSTMNAINLEHNHEQDEKKVERQQLRAQVKRKATDYLTSRPSKIIRTELHKFADKLIGSGDVPSIAQSLYRQRRKVYPILPKSREDVHAALDSMATLNSKDEEFVQVTARKEDKTQTEFAISQYRKYSSGEITRLEYIKSLGYRFMPIMDM